eukprot:CAMPEP_0194364402 /NCGR_PEP_ID=MMETSP0174-20130528/12332_1 /TAXON_ID=216777 /ORGANISM="Proboscia alata, Strain PI-D3" /LENGTH=89 /DNA_ID=CAMNT_0039138423 /DNA_START=373 /DNA_END=638 /DNA_ORIENTATION=+
MRVEVATKQDNNDNPRKYPKWSNAYRITAAKRNPKSPNPALFTAESDFGSITASTGAAVGADSTGDLVTGLAVVGETTGDPDTGASISP